MTNQQARSVLVWLPLKSSLHRLRTLTCQENSWLALHAACILNICGSMYQPVKHILHESPSGTACTGTMARCVKHLWHL